MGIRRTIVSVEVYQEIKKALFEGIWHPGDRVDRKHLAERFGISQTPVNDALNRLAGEGLLESRLHDGFFVPDYSDVELADLFAVRAGLESIAARLCAETCDKNHRQLLMACFAAFGDGYVDGQQSIYLQADRTFHTLILQYSGSTRLKEVETVFGIACRSYEHGLIRPPGETLPEHLSIVDAICRQDSRAAQMAMADHLLATRSFLLANATI
jgi:DNA-binding GntR family transcriptional regulator